MKAILSRSNSRCLPCHRPIERTALRSDASMSPEFAAAFDPALLEVLSLAERARNGTNASPDQEQARVRAAIERMANEALADECHADQSPGGSAEEIIGREGGWLKGASSALAVACLIAGTGKGTASDLLDAGVERPDEIVIRRETAEKLRELVDRLPSDMKTLVKATYFQGHTLTDAAAEVGISKAWASRLHARALGRLAAALKEAGLD